MTAIAADLGLPALPSKASKKQHRIRQILDHVFGADATEEEKLQMTSSLMKVTVKKLSKEEGDVLQMVGALDTENAECFKEIKKYAADELEARLKSTGRKQYIKKMKKLRMAKKGTVQKRLRLNFLGKRRHLFKKTEGQVQGQASNSGGVGRGPAVAPPRVGVTPPELKELLPGRGRHSGKFTPFRGDQPNHTYYRVGYKCRLDAVHS